ncbi:MAG: hypothetical protein IJ092_03100 [Atopobiaceae bacterium]|nr:hypothetical protein [Atopobiaceae bacterium]
MTIQQLADIASRYLTAMAGAMIAACVARSLETGEPLSIPERGRKAPAFRAAYADPTHDEWDRMMRSNSDSLALHM